MQKFMFSTVLVGTLMAAHATTYSTTTPQSYTATNQTQNTTTTTPTTNTYTQTQTTTADTTTGTHASMQPGQSKIAPMPNKAQPASKKDSTAATPAPAQSSSFFDKIRSFFQSLQK